MAKGKYETHVLPYLDKIAAWAAAGATEREIAGKLHIACATFRRYLDGGAGGEERYAALSAAFAGACQGPDDAVEAALYRRACGYRYTEVTEGEKLDKDGVIHTLTKTVTRDMPPDPTSAMFWLTNRRPGRWRHTPEAAAEGGEDGGVVLLSPVMEPPGEEEGDG